jgi:hypothetical protein
MRRSSLCLLALFLLSSLTCFAQQSEIPQFAIVTGYSYLHTPSLNLAQRGFNGDIAVNYRPWMSLGFDFSTFAGGSTLLPSYLNSSTQAQLGQALAHYGIPVSAALVPYTSSTYTYQMGPQFNYRRFKHLTLFVRPALGLLHAKIQTTATNPMTIGLVKTLLNGKLSSADTVFYGFGGGGTWEVTPHFGLRATADLARFNFFPDTLNGSRNGLRLTVATKFGFGRNIMETH